MVVAIAAITLLLAYEAWLRFAPPADWSDEELSQLASLWIGNLPDLPPDTSNAVADNPDAAAFGHQLFFDARLSANGMISCSTCHQPIRHFTDGLPKGVALGESKRNTPSIVGTAYSPWLYWDGRKDSQWAQALAPLEDPNEHGSSRLHVLSIIASVSDYRQTYQELFGAAPDLMVQEEVDRAFANIGKSIAAYERLLLPGEARFDQYVEHVLDGGPRVGLVGVEQGVVERDAEPLGLGLGNLAHQVQQRLQPGQDGGKIAVLAGRAPGGLAPGGGPGQGLHQVLVDLT